MSHLGAYRGPDSASAGEEGSGGIEDSEGMLLRGLAAFHRDLDGMGRVSGQGGEERAQEQMSCARR
jgi:hypothetical protein